MSRHGVLLHGVLSVETEAMEEAQRPSVTPGSQTTLLLCSSSLPTSAPHSVSVLLVLGSYDTLICHSWDLLDVGVRYPEFSRKPPLQCWHSLANTLKDFPWTRPSQAYSPFFLLLPILPSPLRPANTRSLHRFKPSTLIVWGSKRSHNLFTNYLQFIGVDQVVCVPLLFPRSAVNHITFQSLVTWTKQSVSLACSSKHMNTCIQGQLWRYFHNLRHELSQEN